jgi:isoamylase
LEVKDVTWINAIGSEMDEGQWGDAEMRCFGMLLDGRAQTTGVRQRGQNATLLIIINAHRDIVEFKLPACVGGCSWKLLIDSQFCEPCNEERFATGDIYQVTARSLHLFELLAEPQG